MSAKQFHIGLVVNPVAGLGGPSGLKGSDAPDTLEKATSLGIQSAIPAKIEEVLKGLNPYSEQIRFSTVSGAMGADYFAEAQSVDPEFDVRVLYNASSPSSAHDTRAAVKALEREKPDIFLFAGGDGTARDVCAALTGKQVCLGIPSGVKMHSGVFAITPKAVVSVILSMIARKLVSVTEAEVRDIDERSFKAGKVITRHFGELRVPDDQLLVQTVKCSGLPDDEIALNEIAAFVEETIELDTLYLLGSGGSLRHIKKAIGIAEPTLLGVDAWANEASVGLDLNEPAIFALLEQYTQVRVMLSVIGGQGVVLGRGNQQISARILERVGVENIQFIGTQERLLALQGRPLRVDSGDDQLNAELAGFRSILCGYDDYVLYEIAYSGEQ